MIIDGKKISENILSDLKQEILRLKEKNIIPCLAVIMVGENPASKTYVRNKHLACQKVGIVSKEFLLPSTASEKEVLNVIQRLNLDNTIHGILVQLPLPKHLNEKVICENISPLKDVDAFTSSNVGKLVQGSAKLLPCTPAGIITLFEHENINLEGKHCTIIGRSDIVGKPVSIMLLQKNATVTVCHSKTKNIKEICLNSDVLVSAVGKSNFISKDMVKRGGIVIDVGINRNLQGKLCGDVDFERVNPKCSYITPVPGGVGPMTVAMLMKNTVTATKIQNNL